MQRSTDPAAELVGIIAGVAAGMVLVVFGVLGLERLIEILLR
jgi:hypothetical protein